MMRVLALLLLLLVASGCSKTAPALAGGKPLDEWINALQDPDAKVRRTAARKLGNMGPPQSALPPLQSALRDPDAGVRSESILALVKFGPGAADAVPALEQLCRQDQDPRVREYASKAVEKIRLTK